MTSYETPDATLISRYLGGDERAFELLYERYHKALYSYLHKLVPGQVALIDDLFQKTWVKVIKNLPRYKEQNTFLAWAIRIARNLAYDYFRKEKRKSELEDEDKVISKEILPGQGLEHSEMGQAISAAVKELPFEQREVFLLRQEGVSFKEIAELQNSTLNTALGRMHYAVTKLRQNLKGWI